MLSGYMPLGRRQTRRVMVGTVAVGGGAPPAVQGMTKTLTSDVDATSQQVRRLAEAGAELVRVAVPDSDAARALPELVAASPVPLIADIHFDYRLALAAIRAGVHKLRINPGNIGAPDHVRQVVMAAKAAAIPIRIGVNAGSLEHDIEESLGRGPQALVESALRNAQAVGELGFEDLVLSVKASSVADTVNACVMLAERTSLPLHIGITEAGGPVSGLVKSAAGIGALLALGIGDTLRISLTADPLLEVRAAWDLLRAWGIRRRGVEVISCPTCGRCTVDLISLAARVEEALAGVDEHLVVAVMGCAVNGPGEARAADVGLAMGGRKGVLFRRGQVLGSVDREEAVDALLAQVQAELAVRRVDTNSGAGLEL